MTILVLVKNVIKDGVSGRLSLVFVSLLASVGGQIEQWYISWGTPSLKRWHPREMMFAISCGGRRIRRLARGT